LPFAAAILLVAAAYAFVTTAPSSSTSSWLYDVYRAHNGYSLASHLFMTGKDMSLIPVMWTLIHEMRVSVIFPLIFLAIRKIGTVQTIGACLVISIASSFGMTDSISGSWAATLHFLWMFALGSAIAFERDRLRGLIESCPRPVVATLVVIASGLLAVPFNRVWGDFLIGSGAGLLVILCLPKSAGTDVLVSPIPLWLGRVSYSLYLIHLPLLVITVASGYGGPLVFVLLVTLLIAELMYRTVESPSHQLGMFLSRSVLRQQVVQRN
jgi:peptidoglycan/LPS O-acetylase OafA/YrhL